MHVLHLTDDSGPQAAPTGLAMLSDSQGRMGGIDQQVVALGSADFASKLAAADLGEARLLKAPCGNPVMGYLSFRRHLSLNGRLDLLHCWSLGTLTLAVMVAPHTPRVATVTSQPTKRQARWYHVLCHDAPGRTVLLAPSATIRRSLLTGGILPEHVHTLRPGIDMSRVAFCDRRRIRRRWGVDDQTRVLMVLSDPPARADAMGPALAAALASAAEATDLRVVIHPHQHHRQRADRMMASSGHARLLLLEPEIVRPWRILPACDAALGFGPSAGGMSLLWAMAANVPIIAEPTYAVSEIVEDRHSALLTRSSSPAGIARRIGQLLSDDHLAWRLRDTARHEAYSFFSRRRYCDDLAAVYRQVSRAEPVQVPAMASTGGLRFSGRA